MRAETLFPRSHRQEGAELALKVRPGCCQSPGSKLSMSGPFLLPAAAKHLLCARRRLGQLVGGEPGLSGFPHLYLRLGIRIFYMKSLTSMLATKSNF